MQTATSNRTIAEVMYGNFTNVHGATITTGYPLSFTTTAASADGNQAVLPATSQLKTFAGISTSDVEDTGVGKYIAYGYYGSVMIFAIGSSVTVAVDVAMGVANASLGVNSTGLVETYGPVVSMIAIAAATNSPGGWSAGFVRNM